MDQIRVGLQRQEERGYPYHHHRGQRNLGWLQRIKRHGDQADQGQDEGKDVFDQEQRGRALNVVDHPSSFGHNMGHCCKVGVQQHQVGHIGRRVAPRCHGNTAIGVFQGKDVVDPVAGHGHSMTGLFDGSNEEPLLLWGHPAKHGIVDSGLGQFLFVSDLGAIQIAVSVGDPSLCRRRCRGQWVVPGNDLDLYALLREVFKCFLGIRANGVREGHQGHRGYLARQVTAVKDIVGAAVSVSVSGQHQYPLALGCPLIGHLSDFSVACL